MATLKQSVADKIEKSIEDGTLRPGAKLATERELAAEHDVRREVVRGALHQLAELGKIMAIQGSGWYVREIRPLTYPLHTIDAGRAKATADVWDTFVTSHGRTGGNSLVVGPAVPPENIRVKLGLEPGTFAVERRRIRLVDGEQWAISTAWWPLWLAKGTAIESSGQCSPLKVAIELGHGQVRSQNEIGARMPTPEESDELKTGRGIPVMTMLTTGWDSTGRPIRCTSDVFPAHRFLLVVEHSRIEQ